MFNLHQLGWYGFQELSLMVAREVFGQSTMSFLSSADAGRDGAFAGKWSPNGREIYEGNFVFQCKFTVRPSYNLKLSDLKDEIPKIKFLVKKGICDIYVLITNAGVSGVLAEKLTSKITTCGAKHVLILGADWLFQVIKTNTKLRRMVPRVYGLGDLSQILDSRVYAQGQTLLESLKSELSKVVITTSYKKAAEALDKHSFVLLVGEPAAGKTTIASLLAMGALDHWKAPTLKLDTPEKVVDHWNPEDPFQFFWIDDAFGVTQYESTLVHGWNHCMPQIKAMLKNGAKIVMTSRDYIYNRARKDLKESASPLLKESQVVIDVHNLSTLERRLILYNHLKMGDQPKNFRKKIKPFLEFIADLPDFVPETARRISSPFFTKGLYFYEWHLEEFVNRQEGFLVEVFRGFDDDHQAALALIYMNNDKLASPIKLKEYEAEAIKRLDSSLGGCTTALNAMLGNLVQLTPLDGDYFWKFKHPTVGDAFSVFVVQSPELIEIYLQGCPVEKLMDQVTCGDVKFEKAIVVPKSFFQLIINRLNNFTTTKEYKSPILARWGAKSKMLEFLAARCSGEFLVKYVESNPGILDQVASPGLFLDSVAEVDLAYTLHKFKLLPEAQRKKFVETVSSFAINGKDLYALKSEKIKSLFKKNEFMELKENVVEDLVPNLNTLSMQHQSEFTRPEEPDDHMRHLIEACEILEEEFKDNTEVLREVDREMRRIKDWIEENTFPEESTKAEKLAQESISHEEISERSIFDDVDTI